MEYISPTRETTQRVYCNVLERFDPPADYDDDEPVTFYKVEMIVKKKGRRKSPDDNEFTTIVVDVVEQGAIFLYDRAFSNDWHLPNNFRHDIGIPDDVIPTGWLNGCPE